MMKIELPLQRELDFHLLQGLQVGHLFGHLLCPCQLPFRLLGPIWLLYGPALRPLSSSLDAFWRPPGPLLFLGSRLAPTPARFAAFGVFFWGPPAVLGACLWCPYGTLSLLLHIGSLHHLSIMFCVSFGFLSHRFWSLTSLMAILEASRNRCRRSEGRAKRGPELLVYIYIKKKTRTHTNISWITTCQ